MRHILYCKKAVRRFEAIDYQRKSEKRNDNLPQEGAFYDPSLFRKRSILLYRRTRMKSQRERDDGKRTKISIRLNAEDLAMKDLICSKDMLK